MAPSPTAELQSRCEALRSLHRPGTLLLLPNAWDVVTARAVVAAGFPAVATTSGAVAGALGDEDHHGAPAGRCSRPPHGSRAGSRCPSPWTPRPATGWSRPRWWRRCGHAGAGGCNLEDTDHAAGASAIPAGMRSGSARSGGPRRRTLPARHQRPRRRLRRALLLGRRTGNPKMSSSPMRCGARTPTSRPSPTACIRSRCARPTRYAASCAGRSARSTSCACRRPPPLTELAALGVARVSWGTLLYHAATAHFEEQLTSLQE